MIAKMKAPKMKTEDPLEDEDPFENEDQLENEDVFENEGFWFEIPLPEPPSKFPMTF